MADGADRDALAATVAMLVRVGRILPDTTGASYDASALVEPAEIALHERVSELSTTEISSLASYVAAAQPLVAAANSFFDDVLVMADDPELRAARLGLLASVLTTAPAGIDWRALDTALTA